MKVELLKNGLLVSPETDFEEQVLCKMFPHGKTAKAFLKCGTTPAEVLGIKVTCLDNGEKD